MMKKLKSKRGFTLLEVLCAFLVIALSVGLFAAGLGAAVRINVQADEQRTAFFEELSRTETKANLVSGTNVLAITEGVGGPTWNLEIRVYTGNSSGDGLIYYELKVGP